MFLFNSPNLVELISLSFEPASYLLGLILFFCRNLIYETAIQKRLCMYSVIRDTYRLKNISRLYYFASYIACHIKLVRKNQLFLQERVIFYVGSQLSPHTV